MSDLPTEGLWLNLSELGEQRGTSSQAVGKRVRRLEKLGLLTTRKGPNGARLVNVAAFEAAIAATGDAIQTANGGGKPTPSPADDDDTTPKDPVLIREQARRAAYTADLAWMELETKRGNLLDMAEVRQGVEEAGEIIMRAFEGISSRLDDLLSIVQRDGKAAGRAFLRDLGREGALTLARTMEDRASKFTKLMEGAA